MRSKLFKTLGIFLFATALGCVSSNSHAQHVSGYGFDLVNISSDGFYDLTGGVYSKWPKLSENGRFTAFTSNSSMLVEGDSNGFFDVFVHDSLNHTTEIVSISSTGESGNADSGYWGTYPHRIAISGDGRFVAFVSDADNLVNNDTNGYSDVFLRDRLLGTTSSISVDFDYYQGRGDCIDVDISANGKYIVFTSYTGDLVSGTPNYAYTYIYDMSTGSTEVVGIDNANLPMLATGGVTAASINADGRYVVFNGGSRQLYLRDRDTGTTELVSVGPTGEPGNLPSGNPDITADGNLIAFASYATNLTPNAYRANTQIYVRDRANNTTEIISVTADNQPASAYTNFPTISDNGRFVNFYTISSNLVEPLSYNNWGSLIYDRVEKKFEPVSGYINAHSQTTSMTSDGRFVAFDAGMWFVYTANHYGLYVRDRAEDLDNDGFSVFKDILVEDCNDSDAAINPDATEVPHNGIDENCNGMSDDDDVDQDGYAFATDCNDFDPAINPDAIEIFYNLIDENCNGMGDDDDLDQDGFSLAADCQDLDPAINPDAIEIPYNGVDENCNGMTDDDDVDQDGYAFATDCNDFDPAINPGMIEIPYNGIDENCNGMTDDDDVDQDGFLLVNDCNDYDATINPDAYEIFNNGIDENCNGPADDAQAEVIVESLADQMQEISLELLMPPLDEVDNMVSATEVATNRSNTLKNMVDGVSDRLAAIVDTMTDAGKLAIFEECLIALSDIIVKTDGFYGGSLNNDWVTTQEGQDLLYPYIASTIDFVQSEIDKLTTP